MKVIFARLEAAHAAASMAEGMAEVQCNEGDQLRALAHKIWDELVQDDDGWSIQLDSSALLEQVVDNCADQDLDGSADECRPGECRIMA